MRAVQGIPFYSHSLRIRRPRFAESDFSHSLKASHLWMSSEIISIPEIPSSCSSSSHHIKSSSWLKPDLESQVLCFTCSPLRCERTSHLTSLWKRRRHQKTLNNQSSFFQPSLWISIIKVIRSSWEKIAFHHRWLELLFHPRVSFVHPCLVHRSLLLFHLLKQRFVVFCGSRFLRVLVSRRKPYKSAKHKFSLFSTSEKRSFVTSLLWNHRSLLKKITC